MPFEVFSLCFFFFHLVHNSSVCLTSPLSNHSCTKRVPKRTLQISLHTIFSTLICQWGNHVAWGKFPFPGWLNSLCDIHMARYQVYHYSQRLICSGDYVCRVLVRGLQVFINGLRISWSVHQHRGTSCVAFSRLFFVNILLIVPLDYVHVWAW